MQLPMPRRDLFHERAASSLKQAKMSESSVLATNLVNPQPSAIQFSCWDFGSDTVHQPCLFDSG